MIGTCASQFELVVSIAKRRNANVAFCGDMHLASQLTAVVSSIASTNISNEHNKAKNTKLTGSRQVDHVQCVTVGLKSGRPITNPARWRMEGLSMATSALRQLHPKTVIECFHCCTVPF